MEKFLLLLIIVLGTCFNASSQVNNDATGNPAGDNAYINISKSPQEKIKSITDSPIIIKRIPSPTSAPCDIAYDGQDLWVEGFGNYMLYKISPVDGSIIKTIPTNIYRPYGLDFGNGYLWVADADNNLIQQVDTSNGNVVASFPTPCTSVSSYPSGLAWDGQNLWNNDEMGTNSNPNDSTYKINTTGQIIQSHHAFGTAVTGLAWDGQYLWSTDNGNLKIYKINVSSFTVIDTINAPGGDYPNGLAFDGQYLWVSNNYTDSLYQIDISHTNNGLFHYSLTNSSDFFVYPNPASDEITINLSNSKVGIPYYITDQTGRQILTGKLNNKTTIININNLAEGVYLLQVGEMGQKSFKIIKK